MQYGLNVGKYKRIREESEVRVDSKENSIFLVVILLTSLLISRVMLLLSKGDISGVAPFGISFFIVMVLTRDIKRCVVASIGTIIGYATIADKLGERYVNILSILLILSICLISYLSNRKVKEIQLFFCVFVSYFIYGLLISKYDLGVNITLALINTIIIIPITYVLKYGVRCIEEINNNYLFSTEEIISTGILICLIISGVGGVSVFGLGIRNIVAYLLVLITAYSGGGTYGAAIGATMGIIIGLNSGDMTTSIMFYSVSGLIVGIFKDTGKIFSFLSCLIMFIGLSLYSDTLNIISLIEVLIAGVVYTVIPQKVYEFIAIEFNDDKKINKVNELALNEIKLEFSNKVKQLGDVLNTVSDTLGILGENEKLTYNKKGTALVESLADRVCSSCSRCEVCWNREFNITFNSFQSLIESCEENRMSFPSVLEKKCSNKFQLIRGTEKIVNNLNGNETLKSRLEEGRLMLAGHVKNISESVNEMLMDFNKEITINEDLDKLIRKGLNKGAIEYKNVFCYQDTYGRDKIKITLNNCGGGKYCAKKIMPIIAEVMRKPMSISESGCTINPKNDECCIVFEEMPKYYIRSYGAMTIKEGEEYSGDTYSFGKDGSGSYLTLLSDGMGSGPNAGKESSATINLVESFMGAGFSKETSMNMINSIMAMKFDEDEKFSTLDLNIVDLYSGDVSFIKVGGVASFIKRGKDIQVVDSNMPPFGLLDRIEIEEIKTKVKNGDIIITLSDGVLDIDKKNVGVYSWIESFLRGASKDPRQLAADIIEKSKEMSGGISNDDMTVVVSKVYAMY